MCTHVQIGNHRLYFRERAQSRCGSLDFIDHVPGGGDKKVWVNYVFVEITVNILLEHSVITCTKLFDQSVQSCENNCQMC